MTARRTLASPTVWIDGIGLHTGEPGSVRFLPSDPKLAPGLRFVGEDGVGVAVSPQIVVDSRRCTVVQVGERRYSTVEHLLSALVGLGITDAAVEFRGPEAPIVDGSARAFVEAIAAAGVVGAVGEARPAAPCAPIDVVGASGERVVALPSDMLRVTVVIEYPSHPAILVQAASYSEGDDFAREIAPARTYGFMSELDQLRAAGLARGVSLENCVALMADGSADERTPLRFATELARHKLLDVVGDLALAGRPVQAHVVALRPSHAVNSALAARLAAL